MAYIQSINNNTYGHTRDRQRTCEYRSPGSAFCFLLFVPSDCSFTFAISLIALHVDTVVCRAVKTAETSSTVVKCSRSAARKAGAEVGYAMQDERKAATLGILPLLCPPAVASTSIVSVTPFCAMTTLSRRISSVSGISGRHLMAVWIFVCYDLRSGNKA